MKRLLKYPATNAACLGLFSAFYALVFLLCAGGQVPEAGLAASPFWSAWTGFLSSGGQRTIALVMIVLTLLVVALLLTRRRLFDEYHTAILFSCLAVALVLTLIAIAVFYLVILSNANGAAEKFTLFVTVHWVTVVLADLVFVLLCRWR